MTDTMTREAITDYSTLTMGQRLTYGQDGREWPVTVHGFYRPGGSTVSAWVTSPDLPTAAIPYAYPQGAGAVNEGSFSWDDSSEDWRTEPGVWTRDSLYPLDPEPTPEPESPEVIRLRAEVSDLQSQVSTARTVLTQIGTALQETADQSEWCGEYDRRLSELYDALPGRYGFDATFYEAAKREREFDVCVHWTVTQTYSTTVSVTADSADAARDLVESDPEGYVDATSSGGYPDDTNVSWDDVHTD